MHGAALAGAAVLALAAIGAATTLRRIHVRETPSGEREEAVV